MPDSTKTGDVLRAGTKYLADKGVDEARPICELLLGRLLNCRPLELPPRYDSELTEKQLEAMRRGIRRAAAGEPVQYVIGQTEFMGRVFKTDKRALIPRPETESLVRCVLEAGELWSAAAPSVVDVGTGSGIIAITLALEKPSGLYLASDVSEEALALARENAEKLGVADKIAFTGEDLADLVEPGMIDAVVANLPYIRTADYERLPTHIRNHEPRIALDGGPAGIAVIDAVIQDASILLKNGGFIFLEIGFDQARQVSDILTQTGFEAVSINRDIPGKDRVVSARLPASAP